MAWYDAYFGGTTTSTPTVNTSNSPPGQHVWEEDRREEPTVYTPSGNGQGQATQTPIVETPIVTTNEIINEPIDGRSLAILDAQEERRLKNIQQLKSLYASTMSSPGPLGGALYEGLDLSTIFESFGADPTAKRNDDGTLHSSMNYGDMPSEGQIPITDWDKLNFLHHLGIGTNVTDPTGLGAFFAVDSSGNAILDSSGNLIKTGLGNTMSDNFNEIVYGTPSTFNPEEQLSMEEQFKKVEEDYWTGREHDGDSWTDPWANWRTAGRTDVLDQLAPGWWHQKTLEQVQVEEMERVAAGEGPATMTNLDPAYKEELSFDRLASPLHLGQTPQGIEESIHHPYSSAHKQFEQSYYGPDFGFRVSS